MYMYPFPDSTLLASNCSLAHATQRPEDILSDSNRSLDHKPEFKVTSDYEAKLDAQLDEEDRTSLESELFCEDLIGEVDGPSAKDKNEDSLQSNSSQQKLLAQKAMTFVLSREYMYEPHTVQSLTTRFMKRSKQYARHPAAKGTVPAQKWQHYKNLLIFCFGCMLLFTSFYATRNLQSSLNNDVGFIALTCLYVPFFFGATLSGVIVQRLGLKVTLLASIVFQAVYIACNFYPVLYSLATGSALVGFAMGLVWTVIGTFITSTSCSYATVSGKPIMEVLSRFNGIFFMIFQFSIILGMAISSVVLQLTAENPDVSPASLSKSLMMNGEITPPSARLHLNQSENAKLNLTSYKIHDLKEPNLSAPIDRNSCSVTCGANYCPDQATPSKMSTITSAKTNFILFGIFLAFCILGFLLVFVYLDDLPSNRSEVTVRQRLVSLTHVVFDKRMLLLWPLFVCIGFLSALMFGDFTKAYLACPLGIHMIGYITMVGSAVNATASYISGKVQKHVSRLFCVFISMSGYVSAMVVMLFWTPTSDQLYPYFIIVSAWGVGDGVLGVQVNSLLGMMFHKQPEESFATSKMGYAIGVAIGASYAPYLCMYIKVYWVGGVLLVSMAMYAILEIILKRSKELVQKIDV